MASKFDRCVKAVKRKGTARNAYAVCESALNPRKPKRRKRRRAKKGARTVTTTTAKSVRTVVKNPRPLFLVITARRPGSGILRFDGRNFSTRRPRLFGLIHARTAYQTMHRLCARFPSALRGWKLDVEPLR